MASAPYLIFKLHRSQYAVPSSLVQRIIWLPELTPLPESPSSIVGVVNLRGRLVAVMDLCERMGHRKQPYHMDDSVIILDVGGRLLGIIVNEVQQVRNIAEEEMEASPSAFPSPSSISGAEPGVHFLAGVAKIGDEIAMLLDVDRLLDSLAEVPSEDFAADQPESPAADADDFFCPHATPRERAIFRARASKLRQSLARRVGNDIMPLAVVGLNGEYFGIDLSIVRRFSRLQAVTPVPCCPRHVVGQMNLRGDVLTVVDIRAALEMPPEAANNLSALDGSKVVVVQTDFLQVGIVVDDVFDVVHLQPSQLCAVPAARSRGEEYLQSMAPYGDNMMGIIDLPKILHQGSLVVNQEV